MLAGTVEQRATSAVRLLQSKEPCCNIREFGLYFSCVFHGLFLPVLLALPFSFSGLSGLSVSCFFVVLSLLGWCFVLRLLAAFRCGKPTALRVAGEAYRGAFFTCRARLFLDHSAKLRRAPRTSPRKPQRGLRLPSTKLAWCLGSLSCFLVSVTCLVCLGLVWFVCCPTVWRLEQDTSLFQPRRALENVQKVLLAQNATTQSKVACETRHRRWSSTARPNSLLPIS